LPCWKNPKYSDETKGIELAFPWTHPSLKCLTNSALNQATPSSEYPLKHASAMFQLKSEREIKFSLPALLEAHPSIFHLAPEEMKKHFKLKITGIDEEKSRFLKILLQVLKFYQLRLTRNK